jgi:hypothetical protein
MKDQMIFYKNNLDQNCSSCGRFTHNTIKCKRLHYEVGKEDFLIKDSYKSS